RGKGRGRGRARRGPREAHDDFAATELPTDQIPVSEDIFFAESDPPQPEQHFPAPKPEEAHEEDDRPRYMDSAERRTEEDRTDDEDVFLPRESADPDTAHSAEESQKSAASESHPNEPEVSSPLKDRMEISDDELLFSSAPPVQTDESHMAEVGIEESYPEYEPEAIADPDME